MRPNSREGAQDHGQSGVLRSCRTRSLRGRRSLGLPPFRLLHDSGGAGSGHFPGVWPLSVWPLRVSRERELPIPGQVGAKIPGGYAPEPAHPALPRAKEPPGGTDELPGLPCLIRVSRLDPPETAPRRCVWPPPSSIPVPEGMPALEGHGGQLGKARSVDGDVGSRAQERLERQAKIGYIGHEPPGANHGELPGDRLRPTQQEGIDEVGLRASRQPTPTPTRSPVSGPGSLLREGKQGGHERDRTGAGLGRKAIVGGRQTVTPTKGRVFVHPQEAARGADREAGQHAAAEGDPARQVLGISERRAGQVAEGAPATTAAVALAGAEASPAKGARGPAAWAEAG